MDAFGTESGSFWRVGINNEEPWGRDLPTYVIDLFVSLHDVCLCVCVILLKQNSKFKIVLV